MSIRVLELRSVAGTGGGPEKTILTGAKIASPDIKVTVCYLANAGDDVFPIGRQAQAMGLDYVELRERGIVDRAVWRELKAIVRDRSIDIIHGHDYKTDLFAWLLARAEGPMAMATAHGWTGHSWRERLVYYPGHRRLLARFSKVIAVSSEIKRALVRAGAHGERVEVVLNGIDPARFRRDPARTAEARRMFAVHEPDGPATVIGAVGRLEPQKRFDLLIEAFATMAASRPDLRLLIAGEGSSRAALEGQIAALNFGQRCRLVGQADVIQFHHALDLYVQSSAYEGTPNVVLEAMAMETPIVATDVGGTSELATDGVHALIIPHGSTSALVSAMSNALGDPAAMRQRVQAARRRVETELSFARRNARLEEIYRELARDRGRT